ncbi:PREDICTED: dof zinc finger protein DOF5.7-like [Nelumbo nucifera]|uniref:Dof zinc finger protein n=2 Tax=Nelumbo nucifera TaxID=4432 RepID=A0A1U8BKY9_NELNU|nr:PREDICTED: dof zinc finger protein DOF5.7-like [Nelumbo nucifera]DAD22174.1 TPA_asm: hypothetical protein HUJ06_023637 [Nelumbo nucifera]
MMSSDNIPAKQATDDESQNGGRKTASLRPPEQPLKCPRCDSSNTKFCYYNNYSLTQPRHFCKTCRRYWTKGGALRNVPIGGGCRKNKRGKSSSRLSGDPKDSGAPSSDIGGLKFFHGLSPSTEFQLCGGLPFSRLHSSTAGSVFNNQFLSYGDHMPSTIAATATATNSSCFDIDGAAATSGPLMGFNYHIPSLGRQGESGSFKLSGGIQEMGSMNVHSSLASSIESLSYINQDLHWRLQQQRLAMLFGGENQKDSDVVSSPPATLLENQVQKPQPISFQNLGISKSEVSGVTTPTKNDVSGTGITATEWFFDNSYTPTTTANSNNNTGNWNGIHAWTDLHQYSALP